MAIDDNTTYGLTGAQVKDLAQRISAGGGGPTVVQTTGTSTTDAMSQNATTSMVYADPATKNKIQIGQDAVASATGTYPIVIGTSARTEGNYKNSTAIGRYSLAQGNSALAIGSGDTTIESAEAFDNGSIAFGTNSRAGTYSVAFSYGDAMGKGIFDISTLRTSNSYGYNNSQYRLLTGVYDPQSAHDAATKGYVDPSTDTTAPTTSTTGRLGEIRIDTSTNTAYMCVSADSTTSTFIWKQITA